MNPPVERFLDAFREINADTILVFPNNANILLTARQAASLFEEARVEVIPSKTLGEGYFALANLPSDTPAEELVQVATEAAGAVSTGLVSRAIRDAEGVKEGDYIGISGKDILCTGTDRVQVALALADKLEAGSADILLLFSGADATPEESARLQEELQRQYPFCEVILKEGDQPVYDFILVTA